MKSGFVEKRQHERVQVALKASYQLLTEDKAKSYRNNPDFIEQDSKQEAFFSKGNAKDLSEGGMALVGTEAFQVGHKVLVMFEIPSRQAELTYIAEVRWVQQFEEMKRPMYRAGLKFLYLNKGDAKKLHEYVMGRTNRK
jgi:c-di-GMP-binding flagellar brake protein YcgR